MKHIQNMKTVRAIDPISLTNTTATAVEVDATGFSNARFLFHVGATSAGNMTVCKIQSATSSGGSFSDVSGASLASGTITTTSASTLHAIEVDLTDAGIGPFLKVVLTEDNTGATLISCACVLSEADNGPSSATERGLTNEAFA